MNVTERRDWAVGVLADAEQDLNCVVLALAGDMDLVAWQAHELADKVKDLRSDLVAAVAAVAA
jgi:hypothetical protein